MLLKRWPVGLGWTDLGQDQVSQPADTVHVVSVDVSSGEVGEMDLLRHEGPEEKGVSACGGAAQVWRAHLLVLEGLYS